VTILYSASFALLACGETRKRRKMM